eukprot:CAMPEP_0174834784 /NCGR_PEP_ID=MMETSP1114-20130205/5046_1 /TAXON_ID=312471 /ORGANISM="Neobodo designis, Strain CCAP 1951/1" /LENGTH=145 /DNA_ID=CAMNT_0016068713 /DNA_START=78 /DNA_END=511 /DNA_ORIENTATION=+
MSAGVKKEEADEKKHEPANKSGDALLEHVPGTSIPLLVLEHAASSGLDVLVDLVTGYRYRGKIQSFDQHNMNTTLREVVVTKPVRPDYFAQMHEVFVRGSQIVNIVLPSQLAPEYERRAKAYKRFYNAARLAHRKETRKERRAKA